MDYKKNILNCVEYIEENLEHKISFMDIQTRSFLSPYHFSRIFLSSTGETIGTYTRKRRLTKASFELIDSKEKIIDIALKYQFGSQESFTRAFKSQYGMTPAKYRKNKKSLLLFHKNQLSEAIINYFILDKFIMEPKIVKKEAFNVVGMVITSTRKNNVIPTLWPKFLSRLPEIKNILNPEVNYGICFFDPNFISGDFTDETEYDYLAGVEVSSTKDIPEGMVAHNMPDGTYAVFTHKGDLSKLNITYDYIYSTWALKSGYKIAHSDDFEMYDSRFNSMEPEKSELDIYVPIIK